MPARSEIVTLVSAQSTLAEPIVAANRGSVYHWRGIEHLEFDIEVWGAAAATVTNLELMAGVRQIVVIADDDVNAVTNAADTLTVTSHAYKDGDGPVRIANSGGALPGGLAAGTDYWIGVVDANTIKLYASLEDWVTEASAINLTSDGTGTHTISDVATTERMYWLSCGLLGNENDGAITVTATGPRGWNGRVQHRPCAIAYGVVGSTTGAISVTLRLPRPY